MAFSFLTLVHSVRAENNPLHEQYFMFFRSWRGCLSCPCGRCPPYPPTRPPTPSPPLPPTLTPWWAVLPPPPSPRQATVAPLAAAHAWTAATCCWATIGRPGWATSRSRKSWWGRSGWPLRPASLSSSPSTPLWARTPWASRRESNGVFSSWRGIVPRRPGPFLLLPGSRYFFWFPTLPLFLGLRFLKICYSGILTKEYPSREVLFSLNALTHCSLNKKKITENSGTVLLLKILLFFDTALKAITLGKKHVEVLHMVLHKDLKR